MRDLVEDCSGSSKTSTSIDMLVKNAVDLDSYDDFVSFWQQMIEQNHPQGEPGTAESYRFSQMENLAKTALSRLVQPEDDEHGYAGSDIFKSLQNSALICDYNEIILFSNDQAVGEFGLHSGLRLKAEGIELEDGTTITNAIAGLEKDADNSSELHVLKCLDKAQTSHNIAVMRLPREPDKPRQDANLLIVFLNTSWGETANSLLIDRFGLTEAEAEIVGGFANGVTLKQIAIQRKRSYSTIRNQFQSALEKTGCPNQADLLRLLLGVSYLFSQIQASVTANDTKIGKNIELIRQKGRFLDVQVVGDPLGQPFIFLPSVFGLSVTPEIEASLKRHGLLMLGVLRPGFGGTSKPQKGQDLAECLAKDIAALLDNMEIENCVFLGRASAARSVFSMARLIPERILRAYVINSLIPSPFIKHTNIVSKWTRSLVATSKMSPLIATLILGTGHKLLLSRGERFLKRMYKNSEADLQALSDPDVVKSILSGAKIVTQQGLPAGVQDMLDNFEDWSDEVSKVKRKVTLLQGRYDPNVPIDGSKEFASQYSQFIALKEFKDGGGLLSFTHADEIFNLIQDDC